jgi:RNA polymerase sigma-70 factor (ECF subfamily)
VNRSSLHAAHPGEEGTPFTRHQDQTDDELVQRVLDGDLGAYDALMRRYDQLVSRIAFGFGRAHEDARDITQEVFLKAYDNLGSYQLGTNFRAWLLRITSNEGVSWLRRQRRHREGRNSLEIDDLPPQFVDSSLRAEREVLRSERADQLIESLQRLQPRYRAALSMRYFQELSIREISAELVCTEAVTKSLLFRGVRKLRDLLALQSEPGPSAGNKFSGEQRYEHA